MPHQLLPDFSFLEGLSYEQGPMEYLVLVFCPIQGSLLCEQCFQDVNCSLFPVLDNYH